MKYLLMDGYGTLRLDHAFVFTLLSFVSLIPCYKNSIHVRETNKFVSKFGTLNSERSAFAKSQKINREILYNSFQKFKLLNHVWAQS